MGSVLAGEVNAEGRCDCPPGSVPATAAETEGLRDPAGRLDAITELRCKLYLLSQESKQRE